MPPCSEPGLYASLRARYRCVHCHSDGVLEIVRNRAQECLLPLALPRPVFHAPPPCHTRLAKINTRTLVCSRPSTRPREPVHGYHSCSTLLRVTALPRDVSSP